ncbi:hypothetical protein [Rhizobium sp. Rhizsp82]|uniref:hypothetical protein n=1 Tax=Rhizobium sp. Rhizsp82 TaxID=3243057 RepID=UPI0039B424FB
MMNRAMFGIIVVSLFTVFSEVAYSQGYAPGCFIAPAKLDDESIGSFVSSPSSLVDRYPAGGFEMVGRIRALAGSSGDTLNPIVALISQMNSTQKAAVGTGLARAARTCAPSAPEYAQEIQEKVAGSNSPEVTAAFLSALNEVRTAALGAGANGGAAGAGAGAVGGGTAGDSSGGLGGDSSVAQTVGDFTVGSRSRRLVTNVTNIINENTGNSPF